MFVIDDRPLDYVEARVRVRWHFLMDFLCLSPASRVCKEEAFLDLLHHYRQPERYYHTLHHLAEMLDFLLLHMLEMAPRLEVLGLAVFFHDAIYDTRSVENEEQSAAYADEVLKGLSLPEEMIAETQRLILLTKHHEAMPEDVTGQMLLDADLAILGTRRTRYAAYRRGIRQEYWWVPEEAYRAARRQVLQRFLDRERIYFTDGMFPRREERARRNLQQEIEELARPACE